MFFRSRGFTLIEIMVTIAIIGILASIAIPAYQDYVTRAKVTEGLNLASSAKTAVTEHYQTKGSFPNSNTEAGMSSADQIKGNHVNSVEVGKEGNITITYQPNSLLKENNNTILLTPTDNGGSISWNCTGGTLENRYRPSQCRSNNPEKN